MNHFLNKFETFIFDFDGVIFDSNHIKHQNIYTVVFEICGKNDAEKFAEYFSSLNGVPREKKIFDYFTNTATANKILEKYNYLNRKVLLEAKLTKGADAFLKRVGRFKKPIFILSGGDLNEINSMLEKQNIQQCFSGIYAGPESKELNLKKIQYNSPVLFIGDSKIDYLLAEKYGLDFCFMYGYTEFTEWQSFFKNKSVLIIENLKELK